MPQFLSNIKISSNTSGQASSPQQNFSVLVLTKMINKHIKKGLQKWNNDFFFPPKNPTHLLLWCLLGSCIFFTQSSTESTQKASKVVRRTKSFILLPRNGSGMKESIITESLIFLQGALTEQASEELLHFTSMVCLALIMSESSEKMTPRNRSS